MLADLPVTRRLLLGLAALVVLVMGGWLGLIVLLGLGFAAQAPDARAVDGDPCCPVPDAWWQVLLAAPLVAAGAAVVAILLAFGATLAVRALAGRWPPLRLLTVPPVVAGFGVLVVCGAAWVVDGTGLHDLGGAWPITAPASRS